MFPTAVAVNWLRLFRFGIYVLLGVILEVGGGEREGRRNRRRVVVSRKWFHTLSEWANLI